MSVVFTVIIVLLALVFTLLLILLLTPVNYKISGAYNETFSFGLNINSGFLIKIIFNRIDGQNHFLIRVLGISVTPRNKNFMSKKQVDSNKGNKTNKAGATRKATSFLNRDFIYTAIKTAKKLLRHISPKYVYLRGLFGFDEPHITSWVLPFTGLLSQIVPSSYIDLQPVWDEAITNIELDAKGKIIPGYIMFIIFKLFLSRNIRNIFHKIKIFIKQKKDIVLQPN